MAISVTGRERLWARHPRYLRLLAAALLAGAAVLALGSCASAGDPAAGAQAIFAGGCFWSIEEAFEKTPGVLSAVSGFAGAADAPHDMKSAGGADRREAVRVFYDPARIDYARLLDVFWHNVDPLDAGGQFCDRGAEYCAAIFVANDEERRLAEESKRRVAETVHAAVVTEILAAGRFAAAEAAHQDFYKKNPEPYRRYEEGCGREKRLRALWGASGPTGAKP